MIARPRRSLSSYILLAGVLALIIVGALVTFQVVSGLTRSQITERQKMNTAPLDGAIEPTAISNLSIRRKFSETELSRIVFNSISEVKIASTSSPSGEIQTQ